VLLVVSALGMVNPTVSTLNPIVPDSLVVQAGTLPTSLSESIQGTLPNSDEALPLAGYHESEEGETSLSEVLNP
jgi:hypothetical protein